MKKHFLWLTLRLLRKQKLRSRAVFSCILFSSILLHVFCGLGFYFWKQVHGETPQTTSFGSGQVTLMALAAVLLMLVFSCSAVLIRNLFSLTFTQRWKSLERFLILGATGKDILFLTAADTGLLTVAAVLAGCVLAVFFDSLSGFHLKMPVWMTAGIQVWLMVISGSCGLLPVWRAVCRPLQLSGAGCMADLGHNKKGRLWKRWMEVSKRSRFRQLDAYFFAGFMSKKYYDADRRRHRRITFTILAAVLLYVPAADLIATNFEMDQAGLSEKYGITYTCMPQNPGWLQRGMEECRNAGI